MADPACSEAPSPGTVPPLHSMPYLHIYMIITLFIPSMCVLSTAAGTIHGGSGPHRERAVIDVHFDRIAPVTSAPLDALPGAPFPVRG